MVAAAFGEGTHSRYKRSPMPTASSYPTIERVPTRLSATNQEDVMARFGMLIFTGFLAFGVVYFMQHL